MSYLMKSNFLYWNVFETKQKKLLLLKVGHLLLSPFFYKYMLKVEFQNNWFENWSLNNCL